jgi:hypothetical protein
LYDVFHRVGIGLGISELPATYAEWKVDREAHLIRDLAHSDGTGKLQNAYRIHLGEWRYRLLLLIQSILAPAHVRDSLQLEPARWLRPLLRMYPLLVRVGLRPLIQRLLMPSMHLKAARSLNRLAESGAGA